MLLQNVKLFELQHKKNSLILEHAVFAKQVIGSPSYGKLLEIIENLEYL